MQDPFTGKPTCIHGRRLPPPAQQAALQDHHQRRLAALARLRTAAARVGIGTDPDDDLALWDEDELSLLAGADALWGELATAAQEWRAFLPFVTLETFGFPADHEDPLGDGSPRLRRIGSGVEATAYLAADGSVYKFYLPREEGRIGGSFTFARGAEIALQAEASLGSYAALFEKFYLIHALGGMPTEVVGVTPEGVVVAKQTLGELLPEDAGVLSLLPSDLVPIPARFLRAHRDHPRLLFLAGATWFVADIHARNLVRDERGQARVIDLLAAPWPTQLAAEEGLLKEWLARAQIDPAAPLLPPSPDEDL